MFQLRRSLARAQPRPSSQSITATLPLRSFVAPSVAAPRASPKDVAPRRSYSSHSPMSPTAKPPHKKVTINTLRSLYSSNTPITMVTAHDFPSGLAADMAGVDMILVGDSLAMVALGLEDTNQVTLDVCAPLRGRWGRC